MSDEPSNWRQKVLVVDGMAVLNQLHKKTKINACTVNYTLNEILFGLVVKSLPYLFYLFIYNYQLPIKIVRN